MKVHITLLCLADYLPQKWQPSSHHPLVEEIQQNAIKAWDKREPSETAVRFMQQMSERHFRFLNVSQKNANTLVVSRT
ncbi:hypothetical protein B0187_00965 [Haemophilus paracuniculus]|uniref:Hemophilus-specific protein n=1 Tax=Haemophilus paracuniculus TaxID=734 RepID=A0A1T0AVM6_9PAST|nr:hypothetical protein [Haemophilus paracuniculus]OOS00895.1 hypothetical protein B0187_00965 [Haemophilus paracuniculus]